MTIRPYIWVADYDTDDHPGGAQQTNKILLDVGKDLGFDIFPYTLKNFESLPLQIDGVYILNNIARIYEKFPAKLENLIDTKKYIRYEHDYLWMGGVPLDFVEKVFKQARASVFLSPLHKAEHDAMKLKTDTSFLQPSPVDLDTFTDTSTKREDKVLYLGGIAHHKGIKNVFEYASYYPNRQFDMYGWVEHKDLLTIKPANCIVHEPVPYDQIPGLLKKYKYLIHLPDWKEPFGRVVAEAYFSGCELITNSKIGFLSYPWNFEDRNDIREKMKDVAGQFWQNITVRI